MNHGKKPKAAIITWCYNGEINYGQILQCYAMCRLVQRLGYEPKVIRYRRPNEKEGVPQKNKWFVDLYEIWYRLTKVEGKIDIRIGRFLYFIKKFIPLSEQCYEKEQVEKECQDCEALFCGSDQIWNPLVFDEVYFLDFGKADQKRISYAPSGIWETNRQPEGFYQKLRQYLNRFQFITVREEESVEILQKYLDRKVTVVPDPTLLLTEEEWNCVASQKKAKESYVFCYFLGRFRGYRLLLKEIMKKYHVKKAYYTTPGLYEKENDLNRSSFFIAKNQAGPGEFLALIRDAQAVCTDSFHGMIFSIIYKKQFYIFDRNAPYRHPGANISRQGSLLKKLGICGQRIIRCKKDLENIEEIEYSSVNLKKMLENTLLLMEDI